MSETLPVFDFAAQLVHTRRAFALQKKSVKLYCLSDLHADTKGCLQWIKTNCVRKDDDSVHTVFICAGDVSADIGVMSEVFVHLKSHYDDVCFTPGIILFVFIEFEMAS